MHPFLRFMCSILMDVSFVMTLRKAADVGGKLKLRNCRRAVGQALPGPSGTNDALRSPRVEFARPGDRYSGRHCRGGFNCLRPDGHDAMSLTAVTTGGSRAHRCICRRQWPGDRLLFEHCGGDIKAAMHKG